MTTRCHHCGSFVPSPTTSWWMVGIVIALSLAVGCLLGAVILLQAECHSLHNQLEVQRKHLGNIQKTVDYLNDPYLSVVKANAAYQQLWPHGRPK